MLWQHFFSIFSIFFEAIFLCYLSFFVAESFFPEFFRAFFAETVCVAAKICSLCFFVFARKKSGR